MGKLLEKSEMSCERRPKTHVVHTWTPAEKRRRSVGVLACFHFVYFSKAYVRLACSAACPSCRASSEAELGELSVELGAGLVVGGLGAGLNLLLLALVEGGRLDLSLFLESLDAGGLGPAGDGGEIGQRAVLPVGLEAQCLESLGDNHSLLHVVGEGNAIEDLELAEGVGTSGRLVGEHSAEALPEHARGGLPVLGTTAWVRVNALLHNVLSNDLVPLEGARLENHLAADHGDALAREKFLGDNTGEAALEVSSTVNDQLLFEHA